MSGQFVLLPTAPQLEGKTVLDNRDDTGHFIMRGLIEAAGSAEGAGFSRYRWYLPEDPKKMADKLAYVRRFAPYDWLIGTGDYTYKWDELQQQEAIERLRSVRFGATGYIALLDREGRALISPVKKSLEGVPTKDVEPVERAALLKMLESANRGGGFISYEWP
jgi:signal transduction histidine kinase